MEILNELRLALRRLAGAPGFSALAILTLALGLGAHIAVYSLVDRLFVQSLPVVDQEELVAIQENRNGRGFFPLSEPDFESYRLATTRFSDLAAHYPTAPLMLRIDGDGGERGVPETINGSLVTPGYFSLLGVRPALGRFFLLDEGAGADVGRAAVTVISHQLWQSHFGGRSDVLGATMAINDAPVTVVGVAPEEFTGVTLGFEAELWIPSGLGPVGYRWCDTSDRECAWLTMIGRLAPGATFEQAEAEMELLAGHVASLHAENPGRGLSLAPLNGLHPFLQAGVRRLAFLLMVAVTLVLLVAVANLSGMLVARSLTRRKEVAILLSLGAARHRVLSIFLSESLLLALAGGVGGLLLASWLNQFLAQFFPGPHPPELSIDGSVLAYTAGLSLIVGLAVGAVPALQTLRPQLTDDLKEELPERGRSRRGRPDILNVLVVVQIAASLVLMTCTGLLLRSLENVSRMGELDPANVAVVRIRPRMVAYPPEQAQQVTREVVDRLAALPEVEAVSLTSYPPTSGGIPVALTLPEQTSSGGSDAGGADRPRVLYNEVAPGYFDTLRVSLLAGRDFTAEDRVDGIRAHRDREDENRVEGDRADGGETGAPRVVIVNRTLATQLASLEGHDDVGSVVGQTIDVNDDRSRVHARFHVIGVVQDLAQLGYTSGTMPQLYAAYWQDPRQVDARLLVRSVGDATPLLPTIRREIDAIDPSVPVTEIDTLAKVRQRSLKDIHLAVQVGGATGILALLLSALGLYGVLALAVTRRTRMLGIRMALGASRQHVIGLVIRQALLLVTVAVIGGAAAVLLVDRALASYLYGVSATDPGAFLIASITLLLVSILASWWPARRASRIDPAIAMRR